MKRLLMFSVALILTGLVFSGSSVIQQRQTKKEKFQKPGKEKISQNDSREQETNDPNSGPSSHGVPQADSKPELDGDRGEGPGDNPDPGTTPRPNPNPVDPPGTGHGTDGGSSPGNEPSPSVGVPDVPHCTEHDPFEHHGIYNSEQNCRYNHEHGLFPPQYLLDEFKQLTGRDFFDLMGVQMGYAWQTPNENVIKHEGYKYFWKDMRHGFPYSGDYEVASDPVPSIAPGIFEETKATVRVIAYFGVFHNLSTTMGFKGRFHSYAIAMIVGDPATNEIGAIFTGGHADFGQAVAPYQGALVTLDSNPEEPYDVAREPYRAHGCYQCESNRDSSNPAPKITWAAEPINVQTHNKIVGYSFRIRDGIDGVWGESLFTGEPVGRFWCSNDVGLTYNPVGCRYTGTTYNIFQVRGDGVPPELDTDEDGFVNFEGFTDLTGSLALGCTEAGPNCVPFVAVNAPVGILNGDDQHKDFGLDPFDPVLLPSRNLWFCPDGSEGQEGVLCPNGGFPQPSGWVGQMN